MSRARRALSRISFVALVLVSVHGCALLSPLGELSARDRIAAFPKSAPLRDPGGAVVRWSPSLVPFVEAGNDDDAALLLGMAHAHLRLGQMELFRLLSSGRVAEAAGPWARDVDHAMKILDTGRAADEMVRRFPPDTERWVGRYVEGINYYRRVARSRTREERVLGTPDREWTPADVARAARLASADVNWFSLLGSRKAYDCPGWKELKARLVAASGAGHPTAPVTPGGELDATVGAARGGSNAFVVAGDRTASGSPVLASDPHVGLTLPNLWVVIGYAVPGRRVVGLSLPGIPAVAVGRNERLAWGGTNMLSASSALYDVSSLDQSRFTSTTVRRAVRFWPDDDVTLHESPHGPVVTDAALLADPRGRRLALRWRGHEWSDEVTALLRMNRAEDPVAFRAAFSTWAVSGQTFLYAAADGRTGMVAAVEAVPDAARAAGRPEPGPPGDWTERVPPTEIPGAADPPEGYLVSTNNVPVSLDPPLSLAPQSGDRHDRIARLISARSPGFDTDDARDIQTDVVSETSRLLAATFAEKLADAGSPHRSDVARTLASWDGAYDVDSAPASLFQDVLHGFVTRYYGARYGPSCADYLLSDTTTYALVSEDVSRPEAEGALSAAADAAPLPPAPWGARHRLELVHPFGRIPYLGRRFRFGSLPYPGSSLTVMKAAHALTGGDRPVTYGASARFVTDLSDPDSSRVVLFGGQDGTPGAENFMDQIARWTAGDDEELPLSRERWERGSAATVRVNPNPVPGPAEDDPVK